MTKSLSDILLERLEKKSQAVGALGRNAKQVHEVLADNVRLSREIIAGYTHLLKLQEDNTTELEVSIGIMMEDSDILRQMESTLLNDATMLKNHMAYMLRHQPTIIEFVNEVELPILEESLEGADYGRLTMISAVVERALQSRQEGKKSKSPGDAKK